MFQERKLPVQDINMRDGGLSIWSTDHVQAREKEQEVR